MAFEVKDTNQNLELNNSNEQKGKTMTNGFIGYMNKNGEPEFIKCEMAPDINLEKCIRFTMGEIKDDGKGVCTVDLDVRIPYCNGFYKNGFTVEWSYYKTKQDFGKVTCWKPTRIDWHHKPCDMEIYVWLSEVINSTFYEEALKYYFYLPTWNTRNQLGPVQKQTIALLGESLSV